MKLTKISEKKTLLGALWYIMFQSTWVYKWTLNIVYYGGSLIASLFLVRFIITRNWLFIIMFSIVLYFLGKKAWVHHKLNKAGLNEKSLGQLFELYGGK